MFIVAAVENATKFILGDHMLISYNLSNDEPLILQGEAIYWLPLGLKELERVKAADKEMSSWSYIKSSFKLGYSPVFIWNNLTILRICVQLEALLSLHSVYQC